MSGAHPYQGRLVGRAQRLQSKLSGKRGGTKVIALERLESLLHGQEQDGGAVSETRRPFNPPRLVAASRAA